MPLWLAVLLLTASPVRAATGSADLSAQFPNTCRYQGKTGSCHSFAATSLLEAAIMRRGGGVVELSDADLFVRSGLMGRLLIFEARGEQFKIAPEEGGDPYDDLSVALSSGVAYRATVPWEKFTKAYAEFRANQDRVCCRIGKEKPDRECKLKAVEEYCGVLGRDTAANERTLLGTSAQLEKDRAEVKTKLAGLTLERRVRSAGDFENSNIPDVLNKGVCREKGRKQTELLVEQLAAGRPLVICFSQDNLPGWDNDLDKVSDDHHCTVVYAYVTEGEGREARRVFKLRNSWGMRSRLLIFSEPNTHDIDEDHACAIGGVSWLTPYSI